MPRLPEPKRVVKTALSAAADDQLQTMLERALATSEPTEKDKLRGKRLARWVEKWMRQHPGETKDAALMAWIDQNATKNQRRYERDVEKREAEEAEQQRARAVAEQPVPAPTVEQGRSLLPEDPDELDRADRPRRRRKRWGIVAQFDRDGNRVDIDEDD